MRLVQLYDVNSFSDPDGIYLRVRWVEKCMGMYAWIYIMDGEQCEHQKCVSMSSVWPCQAQLLYVHTVFSLK